MNNVLLAARLHLLHRAVLLTPWLVVLGIFAMSIAPRALLAAPVGDGISMAPILLPILVLAVFFRAVTQVVPYGLSLGLTRRSSYAGTALTALAIALGSGVVLTLLTALERASGGWGTDFRFFAPGAFAAGDPLTQVAVSTAPLLAAAFVSMAAGATQLRWGSHGVLAVAAVLVPTALVVFFDAAVDVRSDIAAVTGIAGWLRDNTAETVLTVVPSAVALLAAGYAYLVMRRAVL